MDIGRMVGLHMLHHQIIRLTAVQSVLQIVQPGMGKAGIHRIHDSDLLIQDHIGIISHTVGDNVLTFKQVDLMVINANILNIVCDIHGIPPKIFLLIYLYHTPMIL